ncbi:MAG TPA: SCO family protein [Rhizomicrobium sp.]|jgi:protein SCO1/2|nr:SCO family protein [Rhizomicrobium sp.]
MLRFSSIAALVVILIFTTGCGPATHADATDIAGVMPPLAFSMLRVNDAARVSAHDYRGKTVFLYFGYTHCPDECPTTLANIAAALRQLGPAADDVRVLFVTVDPARDTAPVLRNYVHAFAPQIDGLRGNENAVAMLARRYRILYKITPASPGQAYEVMHSDSLFLFDGAGKPKYVLTSTRNPAALAARIRNLNG